MADENLTIEQLERIRVVSEIEDYLREKPQLMKLMRAIKDLDDNQLDEYMDILKKKLQGTT